MLAAEMQQEIGPTTGPISSLDDLGITKNQSSRWQQEASDLPPWRKLAAECVHETPGFVLGDVPCDGEVPTPVAASWWW